MGKMEFGSKEITDAVLAFLSRVVILAEDAENKNKAAAIKESAGNESAEAEAEPTGISAEAVEKEKPTGMENSNGMAAEAVGIAEAVETENSAEMAAEDGGKEKPTGWAAKAVEIAEVLGMGKSTGMAAEAAEISESSVKSEDFLPDYVQLYNPLPGIPRKLTTSPDALPMEFRQLHKYLGRAVEVYVSYNTVLRGTLESLDGNLDCVLSDCYEDYYYFESQYFVGTVHVEGKHLKFITEMHQ